MSGGKRSREKGDRYERKIVRLHHEAGMYAERVPLSGSAGGSFAGDLRVGFTDRDACPAEVKMRGAGFKRLYYWLTGVRLLFLIRERSDPLVVMGWGTYITLMHKAGAWNAIQAAIQPENLVDVGWEATPPDESSGIRHGNYASGSTD